MRAGSSACLVGMGPAFLVRLREAKSPLNSQSPLPLIGPWC